MVRGQRACGQPEDTGAPWTEPKPFVTLFCFLFHKLLNMLEYENKQNLKD